MENILEVKNLTKQYNQATVVDNLSFSIKKGDLFSLLGTNGAGKSTTINIICTFIKKNSGTVTVGDFELDKENKKIREIIGVVFQQNVLDPKLTVKENLRIRSDLYKISTSEFNQKLQKIAKSFEFTDILDKKFENLSGGQQRRVEIARAVIHEPQILLLDEPTTGLDPKSRQQVWALITKLQKENNMTILLTTHYLEEAIASDDIAIVSKGKIIAQGTAHELQTKYSSDRLIFYPKKEKENALIDSLISESIEYTSEIDSIKINLPSQSYVKKILCLVDGFYDSYELYKGSLDDAFIKILESNERIVINND